MHPLAQAANFSMSAAGGANGLLVALALFLFAVAAILAAILAPRNWWAILVGAGLAMFMLALLVGS